MDRKLFSAVIRIFFFVNVQNAQHIDSVLNLYNERFASEKIHVQTDRSIYRKGETVFYKAYVLSNSDLSTLSKTLYTDWYDESGKLVKQTEAPLLFASAKGSFDIPADYKGYSLYLIAYTKWMLNFDTAFVYRRKINIYHSQNRQAQDNNNAGRSLNGTKVELYPEGGFSVAELENRFAFKATDLAGDPVNVKGIIADYKGNILDSFISVHDGMGSFSLLMEKGKRYFFKWIDKTGITGQQELVAEKQTGVCLQVMQQNKKIVFRLQRTESSGEEFKNLHLLVHKNEFLRFKYDIDMTVKTVITAPIDLGDLPTGVVQFTLFNSAWIPVAERIVFVNNQNHLFTPSIVMTKKDLSVKGYNEIEINTTDTLLTNMSLAITDAGVVDSFEPDIFSDLLLLDELKGPVYHPAYYLQQDSDDSVRRQLDLVLLTNGHRRFDWEKITRQMMPEISYPADTSYAGIKGRLKIKKLKNSGRPVILNAVLETKDSIRSMLSILVKADGSFQQNNLFIFDSVKLYYSVNSKIDRPVVVEFAPALMNAGQRIAFFENFDIPGHSVLYNNQLTTGKLSEINIFDQPEVINSLEKEVILKEVKVITKAKTSIQILDDYYTSGMYSGNGNNIAVDVEGDIHRSGQSLWYYLQSKIPGLTVNRNIPLWYPNSQGFPDVPAFLLDEAPVSLETVSNIDINSIAYVKAFRPPFLGSMLNGFSGVIALYSKRGYAPVHSASGNETGLESTLLIGYSKFREFIQPNYTDTKKKDEPDARPTLYWNPYLIADKNNPKNKIFFYNNDISKKLCLVLEGINSAGKMTRMVKLLE